MGMRPLFLPFLLTGLASTLPAIDAGAVQVQAVPIVCNDVVYNPHDGQLYVSVPSLAPSHGNTITRIDPTTGTIGPSVAVGSEPRRLALSSDGTTLYVGLDGAAAVRRVDLGSFTAGLQFSLGTDPTFGPLYAADIEVLPGNANAVAVSLRGQGFSPSHMGVAVFDNGVPRANRTQRHTGSNLIVFSASASRMYGQNIETTEFGFRRLDVTGSGVAELDVTQGLSNGFGGDIAFDAGRVYSSGGEVIDPEARVLLGRFSFPDNTYLYGAMAPDGDRVFFATSSFGGYSGVGIHVFDPVTFTPVLGYTLRGIDGTPTTLRRWGANGLAMRTDAGGLVLLRQAMDPPTCDLALTKQDFVDPVVEGDYITYQIRVSNLGDAPAEQPVVRDTIPPITQFQYAYSTQGYCYDSLGTLVCTAFSLAPRESLEITVAVRTFSPGFVLNRAYASSVTPDVNPFNNSDAEVTEVRTVSATGADVYVEFSRPPQTSAVDGDVLEHALVVGNRGPSPTGVTLYGGFYGAPYAMSVSTSQGSCQGYFGSVACSLGVIPPGGTVQVTSRVALQGPGFLSGSYSAYSTGEPDPDYSNNFAGTFCNVRPSAPRLIDSLSLDVQALGLHNGPEKTFLRKLGAAKAALVARDTASACAEMEGFADWISRRTGRALDMDDAIRLFVETQFIRSLLGCIPTPGDSGGGDSLHATVGAAPPAAEPGLPTRKAQFASSLPTTVALRVDGAGALGPSIDMPAQGRAELDVIDVQGRVVKTLFNGSLEAGTHRLPRVADGLSSGVYFYRLRALGVERVNKVVMLK